MLTVELVRFQKARTLLERGLEAIWGSVLVENLDAFCLYPENLSEVD